MNSEFHTERMKYKTRKIERILNFSTFPTGKTRKIKQILHFADRTHPERSNRFLINRFCPPRLHGIIPPGIVDFLLIFELILFHLCIHPALPLLWSKRINSQSSVGKDDDNGRDCVAEKKRRIETVENGKMLWHYHLYG